MATVAFEVVGTLFSLDAPKRELVSAGAPPHVVDLLVAQTLRDYFALSHAGGYAPLDEVLEDAPPRALASVEVEVDPETSDRILGSFRRLDPAEGASRACERLGNTGFQRIAVTNSSRDSTIELIDRADLNDLVDQVISCDSIGIGKPHPEVYDSVREVGDPPIWMVAAHG